jgi:excisionase family DNA binding protein
MKQQRKRRDTKMALMMAMPRTDKTQFMSRAKVAQRLDVSLRLVDGLVKSKTLKSMTIGKKRLISEASLLDFIRRREAAAK